MKKWQTAQAQEAPWADRMSASRQNILVLSAQVPFTFGGAEFLAQQLVAELRAREFAADLVQLPFSALPKKSIARQMALWRSLDIREFAGRKVDLVIPTKFPSYMVAHPNKIPWLVHQHRQAYELYGTRFGDFETTPEDEALRQMIVDADTAAFAECKKIFTISENVSRRLKRFLNVSSTALRPPLPQAGEYKTGEKGDEVLVVGRLCSIKRVDLALRAFAKVKRPLKLTLIGGADEPAIEAYLKSEIDKHHLWDRVELLGSVPTAELLRRYANCFAVCYVPFDEDYGFVSIEARAFGKPMITTSDSGTVLDFVRHEENGLVAEPKEESIAEAINRLLEDEALYQRLAFTEDPKMLTASWDKIIGELTS